MSRTPAVSAGLGATCLGPFLAAHLRAAGCEGEETSAAWQFRATNPKYERAGKWASILPQRADAKHWMLHRRMSKCSFTKKPETLMHQ
eukprot:s2386_g8.t1